MDELLLDFLIESAEQLASVGAQLKRAQIGAADARIMANAFRLVHAIRSACAFLNLPRLEKVAHTTEILIGATDDASSKRMALHFIVQAIDRMSLILAGLAEGDGEPKGDDDDLIRRFETGISLPPACDDESPSRERPIDSVRASSEVAERYASLASDEVPADEIANVEKCSPDIDFVCSQREGGVASVSVEPMRVPGAQQFLDCTSCRRTRLLVIEEAAVLRRMLGRTLRLAGYEVECAADLSEALHTIQHSPRFDGALADLENLAASRELCRIFVAVPGGEPLRVVALAAHSGEGAQNRAHRAGFVASAGKFDRPTILSALRASGLESQRSRMDS